jgi:hypothetical protein
MVLSCRSRLELGAYETAPRTARGHIARVLEEWSLAEFRDVTALIASELITNPAAQIARHSWTVPPPVRLWLRYPRPAHGDVRSQSLPKVMTGLRSCPYLPADSARRIDQLAKYTGAHRSPSSARGGNASDGMIVHAPGPP